MCVGGEKFFTVNGHRWLIETLGFMLSFMHYLFVTLHNESSAREVEKGRERYSLSTARCLKELKFLHFVLSVRGWHSFLFFPPDFLDCRSESAVLESEKLQWVILEHSRHKFAKFLFIYFFSLLFQNHLLRAGTKHSFQTSVQEPPNSEVVKQSLFCASLQGPMLEHVGFIKC